VNNMNEPELRQLLADVAQGSVAPDEAARRLRRLPFADLGFARVDHHRSLRVGMPEAIYGPGKSPEQCAALVAELLSEPSGPVLLTRADEDQVKAALAAASAMGHEVDVTTTGGRLTTLGWRRAPVRPGRVVVMTAGTADLPVAEESRCVLAALGIEAELIADCGVAGLHRLLAHTDTLQAADAVIVVAGMEGALASVIGGLTGAPVIAVPTSAGYGASLDGVTALLSMLSSCASGVTVVGIDNGYGAACALARLLP
jgi:NCAIR mutase (PurE)-related protein